MRWLGSAILLLLILMLVAPSSYAATYYISPSGSDSNSGTSQGSPVRTFDEAFSLMNGGDTLILLDGVYGTSTTGQIGAGDIPNGPNKNTLTTIKSLNGAGAVRYDKVLTLGGESGTRAKNIKIQGILFAGTGATAGGLGVSNGEYIYIKECGMRTMLNNDDWQSGFGVGSNDHSQGNKYILVEDSWVWGNGKNGLATFCSNSIVYRRVIVRHNGCLQNGGGCQPVYTVGTYNSRKVSHQNVMLLDTKGQGRSTAGFQTPKQSGACDDNEPDTRLGEVEYLGTVAYNGDSTGYYFDISQAGLGNGLYKPTMTVENAVSYGHINGEGLSSYVNGGTAQNGEIIARNIFTGTTKYANIDFNNFDESSVRDAIAYDTSGINFENTPTNAVAYSGGFEDGCNGQCSTANPLVAQSGFSNPCTKYMLRVEEDSACSGAGTGGSDIGANVVGYGTDGTFWGESGYKAEGDFSDIWPWKNEELIKEQICDDDPGGRGLCADYVNANNPGRTITEYLWEDPFGNDCPTEICDPVPVRCDQRSSYGQPCEVGVGACYDAGTMDCNNPASMTEQPSCNAVEGTPTTEICNNVDDDCDGIVDNGFDQDGDGYAPTSCPGGNDCNDNNANINPGAAEICSDGIDSNCNGNSDETEGNGCLTVGAGMVGYYPFEGNAQDATGNGNNGVVNGPTITTGYDGQAYNFDGNNDYINLGNDATLQNLDEFTYTAWIYPTSDGTKNILSKDKNKKELRIQGTGSSTHLRGCVRSGNSNYCSQSSGGSIVLNQWQHVAVTYNDNTDRQPTLYINGQEVSYSNQPTASGTLNTDDGQDLNIGRRTINNDRYFDGVIDDVRIYNRALSAGEIASIGTPAPTCNDGIQNQDETGIDCGGSCPACPPPPVCGNNLLESGEACDDGNTQPGDGCDSNCQLEITQGDCSASNILCVGGPNSEYNTIQQAANNVGAGDTVQVYDGNWAGFEVYDVSGTSSNPIIFRAVGENVVINSPTSGNIGIHIDNSGDRVNYITVEGFTIQGNNIGSCIRHRGASASNPSQHGTFKNNKCYLPGGNSFFSEEGFYLSHAQHVFVEGNLISNAGGHGIYLANAGSDDAIIKNNVIDSSGSAGIHMNGDASIGGDGMIDRAHIEGNIITNTEGNGGSSKALSLDGVQDSTFINNVLYNWDADAGLRAFEYDGSAGPGNLVIAGNTFVLTNGKTAIKFTDSQGGHTIFNNIFAKEGSGTDIDSNNNNYDSDHNLEASVGALLFADPGAVDYRLTAGSPAIDAGVASFNGENAPTIDLDGNSRPAGSGYDIGAYEYGSTGGGPSCSDGMQNQGETGVDCGGPCPACPASCSDGVQNGQETGIDCGGSCPACAATCSDGIQNQDETGIDCGGSCPACIPTCSDGIQNQGETGVDCGGPCPACVVPELLAYYDLEGSANDKSGNSYHATNNGATFAAGRIGQGISFDGGNDYLALPGFPSGLTDFTVALWVYWNGGADWQRIIDFNDGTTLGASSGKYWYLLPQNDDNNLAFAITNNGYNNNQLTEGAALTTSTWTHVALVKSGNQITIYKDGTQYATGTASLNPNELNTVNHWLGRSGFTSDPYFDGMMDEVYFYNYALSVAEIQTLYQDTGTGCTNTGDLNCDNTVNIFDLVRAANPRIRPANWVDLLLDVFNNFGMNY